MSSQEVSPTLSAGETRQPGRMAMTAVNFTGATIEPIAVQTPVQTRLRNAKYTRGLSDRGIAWLFITPTIALLLAINIFPLIWMIRLSFTSLNLSMS